MNSSYFNFSDLEISRYDAIEQIPSEHANNYSILNDKQAHLLFTQAPSEQIVSQASRSKKTCSNPFESSFQINFLYEHSEACEIKLQNFMESISSCSEKIEKESLKRKILAGQSKFTYDCYQILDSSYYNDCSSEKQKFRVDLQYEKKLKEYLDSICSKFSPQVSGQLVAIANYIWVQYIKVMDQRLSLKELKVWAQNLVENKFNQYKKLLEKTKDICFQEDESQVFPNFQEAIKGFMNYYFVTVTFVIEQFFQNPFFNQGKQQVNSFKRASLEDDLYNSDQFSELEDDIFGAKKLKF